MAAYFECFSVKSSIFRMFQYNWKHIPSGRTLISNWKVTFDLYFALGVLKTSVTYFQDCSEVSDHRGIVCWRDKTYGREEVWCRILLTARRGSGGENWSNMVGLSGALWIIQCCSVLKLLKFFSEDLDQREESYYCYVERVPVNTRGGFVAPSSEKHANSADSFQLQIRCSV